MSDDVYSTPPNTARSLTSTQYIYRPPVYDCESCESCEPCGGLKRARETLKEREYPTKYIKIQPKDDKKAGKYAKR